MGTGAAVGIATSFGGGAVGVSFSETFVIFSVILSSDFFLKISIFYDSASGLLNERNIRKALQFKYEMQIERPI